MKARLLITGASGFIGYHLIQSALQSGMEVDAAVRSSSKVDHLKGLDVNFVEFDFFDTDSIKKNFEKGQYDYIVHAAGVTKAHSFDDYVLANVQSTANLAIAALEFPVKKFLFISSLAALGPIKYDDTSRILETTAPNPVTNYGRSKLIAENELIALDPLPWLIFRPTAVYGPRERDLLIMFKSLKRGLEPYIGHHVQSLSFLYVKDLASLTIKALKSSESRKIYNISDGHAYTQYDLANTIKKIMGRKTIKVHLPVPVVRVIAGVMESVGRNKTPALNVEKIKELTAENWSVNIEKAMHDLGYLPRYNLEAGIEETLEWYKQNNWL